MCSQCEYGPTDVLVIPKGAMAQWEKMNGSTNVDWISSLELQYQHQYVATIHSCTLTVSSSRFLGDHHAVMTEVVLFLALGQLSNFPTVDNRLGCLALVSLSDTSEIQF